MTVGLDFAGRVALVTGATNSIGRAIAEALAQCGAHVIVNSEDLAACQGIASRIGGTPVDRRDFRSTISSSWRIVRCVSCDLGFQRMSADRYALSEAITPYGTSWKSCVSEQNPWGNLAGKIRGEICKTLSRKI